MGENGELKKPIHADLECIIQTIIESYCVFKVGDVHCIMASMIRVVVCLANDEMLASSLDAEWAYISREMAAVVVGISRLSTMSNTRRPVLFARAS